MNYFTNLIFNNELPRHSTMGLASEIYRTMTNDGEQWRTMANNGEQWRTMAKNDEVTSGGGT